MREKRSAISCKKLITRVQAILRQFLRLVILFHVYLWNLGKKCSVNCTRTDQPDAFEMLLHVRKGEVLLKMNIVQGVVRLQKLLSRHTASFFLLCEVARACRAKQKRMRILAENYQRGRGHSQIRTRSVTYNCAKHPQMSRRLAEHKQRGRGHFRKFFKKTLGVNKTL